MHDQSETTPTSPGRDKSEHSGGIRIGPLISADAGEVLTLQRAAYVSEARIYHDMDLPPLTESLAAIRDALSNPHTVVLGMRDHTGRLLAAGRVTDLGESRAYLARLAVAPDMQGRGLGTRLLQALEHAAPANPTRLELCTGAQSLANLRLYQRMGYHESHRSLTPAGHTEVHLAKITTE